MIWIDITDPKYALFFREMLPALKRLDSLLITTRKALGYTECADLLEKFGIQAHCIGGNNGYGGSDKASKLESRLKRQAEFLELFKSQGTPSLFLTGASVEGVQSAFGLGIPVVIFSDTPIAGHTFTKRNITILSRLSLPLASLVFIPFVLPRKIYSAFGLESSNVCSYDFIDVALWLSSLPHIRYADQSAKSALLSKYNLCASLPLILAREEEYKAHYVKEKTSLFYESVHYLAKHNLANILIIPRYERQYLCEEFGCYANVAILEKALFVEELYPCIDLLLGGGGTMNLESSFLGIPTISTRSLLLYHDIYLLRHNLMIHCTNLVQIKRAFAHFCMHNFKRKAKRDSRMLFMPNKTANIQPIIDEIQKRFYDDK